MRHIPQIQKTDNITHKTRIHKKIKGPKSKTLRHNEALESRRFHVFLGIKCSSLDTNFKVMRSLLHKLGGDYASTSKNKLQALGSTFRVKNQGIIFQPKIWDNLCPSSLPPTSKFKSSLLIQGAQWIGSTQNRYGSARKARPRTGPLLFMTDLGAILGL
ncbi:UNVERIFIED_CONTAM: hypothetical protein Slati_3780500 [Sesamum latifolium]|uniref:Uncharacterized protein n=1 Tax=Sesamum latifolium TaxID=2727402 RepID=A0AAW2U529_9LAMI